MDEPQKRIGAGFLATVVILIAILAYPMSIGPVCWWFAEEPALWLGGTPFPKVAPYAYWPIGWLAEHGPRPVHDAIFWYAARRNGRVLLPIESSGQELRGPGGRVS